MVVFLQILRKIGKKGKFGGAGEMFEPRLCQCDNEGTILIADPRNENMQVRCCNLNFKQDIMDKLLKGLV